MIGQFGASLRARLAQRHIPADPDSVNRYAERFSSTARLFKVFVQQCKGITPTRGDKRAAVVVMPWYRTPFPWLMVAIGLGLARRGVAVTFVWHDVPFPEHWSLDPRVQHAAIKTVLRGLGRRFPVIRLSHESASPPIAEDVETIEMLAQANLTWNLRGADPSAAGDSAYLEAVRSALNETLPKVRSFTRRGGFDYVVSPGGILGPSGLYVAMGHEAGLRVATVDGGVGWTEVNTDGVAAQQSDTARALELLEADLQGDTAEVIEASRAEFARRRAGTDRTSYQHANPNRVSIDDNVLVPLSVVFDASALGKQRLFANATDALVATVGTLLDTSTSVPIVVRQHPSERKAAERGRFQAGAVLAAVFGDDPRVVFISADDPTSTYDLLDSSRLVLPFVSTFGIEAAAAGKPVVVSGDPFYAELGIAYSPGSRENYFELLARGVRGGLPPLPNQTDRAWLCFYLNAVCHRVWGDFGPQPPDFWRWVTRQPEELFEDPTVVDILDAIDSGVPLSFLRHRRFGLTG